MDLAPLDAIGAIDQAFGKSRVLLAEEHGQAGTLELTDGRLILRELAPGVSVDYVQERTEPRLDVASDLHEMSVASGTLSVGRATN